MIYFLRICSALYSIHDKRICHGALRISSAGGLYVANEPCVADLRIKLALQYLTKLRAHIWNPTYNCIFHSVYIQLYYCKVQGIPSLGIHIQQDGEAADIDLTVITYHNLLFTAPWQLAKPNVNR